ncbi:YidH family protein [Erythrobacter sp. YT30]|uniref:YidH family protein n=1 Tax=Erythrobacter sp. YT30 TaxID=1735012 RepID=UPI00076BE47B|nr:DUF202 domain-containing protein [Erythrobacter sp. YT30]KWV92711.1 hypothetical protein AUC45_00615 [Erythrobacter sp. YT30]
MSSAGDSGNTESETRTDLAEDRTILANERTFAGWMRTGLATVGIGLAFNAVFTKIDPAWIARSIASLFVFVGIMIFYIAQRKSCQVIQRMDSHEIKPIETLNMRLIAGLMSLASALLLMAIWFLM